MALGLFDVGGPGVVLGHGVDTEADDLAIAFFELRLQAGHVTEFGGADGGEVFGVREQNCPAVAHPLVEIDGSLGGFGGEVGGLVVDSEHDFLPMQYCFGLVSRQTKNGPPVIRRYP